MVITTLSRRSSRPATALSSTDWGVALASSITASGNSRSISYWYRRAATALSRSPAGPNTSRMVPMGGCLALPKLVMATAARSPARTPFRLVSTWMGPGSRSLSGRSHSPRLCRTSTPVTVLLARSTTAVIRAVRRRPSSPPSSSGRASTRSPCHAPPSARGGMNQSSSRPPPSSGTRKPKPRLVA